MYHRGPDTFFADWQEFTGASAPPVVNRRPRLVLIARGFHGGAHAALDFLVENGLPVQILEVAVYQDAQGRKFANVESEHEPELPVVVKTQSEAVQETTVEGRRVTISDLIEAELLQPGDELVWDRPRLGNVYRAKIRDNAAIELEERAQFRHSVERCQACCGHSCL